MIGIVSILAAVCVGIVFLYLLIAGVPGKKGKSNKTKDRTVAMRDATKKLAQNPRDAEALQVVGNIYYQDGLWDKAVEAYDTLLDLCVTHPNLDRFEISLRHGLCLTKQNKLDEALKSLMLARSIDSNNFDVCYNLGYICYQKKDYEKAVAFLRQALVIDSEHGLALKYMGYSLHKSNRNKEAITYLKRALDVAPEDKETMFLLGESLFNMNALDRALKIFTHLRPDPERGPQAALYAGTIHSNIQQPEAAVADFEIGLKHMEIAPDIRIELEYRLAVVYLKIQNISSALQLLKGLQIRSPGYKDVQHLIARYQDMNSNKNLQIYLMSSRADFVTLCRKIVMSLFNKARIKILDISITAEYCDVMADVETAKWQDLIQFRFFRSTGAIGELLLRDFNAKVKEVKAGKGYCLTSGVFSEEAKRFVEARLIDLVEKDQLIQILNNLG